MQMLRNLFLEIIPNNTSATTDKGRSVCVISHTLRFENSKIGNGNLCIVSFLSLREENLYHGAL